MQGIHIFTWYLYHEVTYHSCREILAAEPTSSCIRIARGFFWQVVDIDPLEAQQVELEGVLFAEFSTVTEIHHTVARAEDLEGCMLAGSDEYFDNTHGSRKVGGLQMPTMVTILQISLKAANRSR